MDNDQTISPLIFLSKAMTTGLMAGSPGGEPLTAAHRIRIAKILLRAEQSAKDAERHRVMMERQVEMMRDRPFP